MSNKMILALLAGAAILCAGGYGMYRLGMSQAHNAATVVTSDSAIGDTKETMRIDPATGKRILYWHDPMVPGQHFDKPGKSPFMDMQLVPVYAEDGNDDRKIAISPRMQQSLGIRTAEATKIALAMSVKVVGSVAWNERDVAMVQARSNGFVEKLFVRAPLDPVRKGQPLAELYVPNWIAAQEEFLTARRMQAAGLAGLADAARQRMRLAGMSDEQIRLVETTGKVHARFTVTSPIGGVVAELTAREGMTVMAGAPLFRINGLDTVWVVAEIPESQSAQLRPGNVVDARAPALPNEIFKGKVSAILPEVSAATRTVKARVELQNPAHRLVPGMFATVDFTPAASSEVLAVPSEAVIRTGRRNIVMVAQDGGKFVPAEIETGAEGKGMTEIRKGLNAGTQVVVSGQFLIDSEASLRGMTARMGEPATAAQTHRGVGKIEAIGKDAVTISHEAIPSLKWDAMTMDFKMPVAGLPNGLKRGDGVQFDFRETTDGGFELTRVVSIDPLKANAANGSENGPNNGTKK
jgi:Cu(I)/Ag(I) efflux system membrane fusion protein